MVDALSTASTGAESSPPNRAVPNYSLDTPQIPFPAAPTYGSFCIQNRYADCFQVQARLTLAVPTFAPRHGSKKKPEEMPSSADFLKGAKTNQYQRRSAGKYARSVKSKLWLSTKSHLGALTSCVQPSRLEEAPFTRRLFMDGGVRGMH